MFCFTIYCKDTTTHQIAIYVIKNQSIYWEGSIRELSSSI